MGLPEEPLKAAERILKGRETFINAGWINRERFFVLMAGVGFDAEAVCSVSSGLKKGLGKLSYVLSGLKVLIKNPLKTIQVSIDGKDRHSLYGIIVCNSSRYAGNFRVCPDASLFSPELHALLIERGTRKDTLKAIVGIVTGKHLKYKGLAIKRGRHFRIEGPSKVQIDGDCYGRLPAEIELRERVVRVIL
ncbi:MAG: hypothetical protein D6710_02570 [Nitrospirae bacterium]|nr:MAG: hypothetical protein D6710_02570 [Nitrospirota bacterium]